MLQANLDLLCSASVGIGLLIVFLVVALCIGGAVGFIFNKTIVEKKINTAKTSAKKIIEDALSEAKTQQKELLIEAKDEALKIKTDVDKEMRERRSEVQRLEDRIVQREDVLNKKEDLLDKKQEAIDNAKIDIDNRQENLEKLYQNLEVEKSKVINELEKIAKLSQEDAKRELLNNIEEETKKDAANIIRNIEEKAKEEGNKRAVDILTSAIQRCSVDHTAELTVTAVALPNDEMKGRLIGREGRNIRAIETATGCDLIIDDTPDTVILSSFDPVRREIARISLEKLMLDGRIHPARIEEMVEKVTRDVDNSIKEAGENASYDADVHGLHPAMTMLLGRLKYRTSYGQNVLKHSLEVSSLAAMIATELGADVKIARRAGLLHDIGKAVDHEVEGTHALIGGQLARKYKETEEIAHCIEAHHNEVEPKSVEAIIVQIADSISGSRPGARRESLENYIKRMESLEKIANTFKGVEKSFAIQAGREVRIIVKPDEVSDDEALFIARDVARQIEKELEYPGQIKVNVIRESRKVDYAK